jgi:hypothetical protein
MGTESREDECWKDAKFSVRARSRNFGFGKSSTWSSRATAPTPCSSNLIIPTTTAPLATTFTMAKDIKEKKEKKEKRSEVDGVKKSKKDKKEKKSVAADAEMVDALEAELEKAPEVSLVKVVEGEEVEGALVPFAFPLADDSKEVKKILKTVKKCTSPKSTSFRMFYVKRSVVI